MYPGKEILVIRADWIMHLDIIRVEKASGSKASARDVHVQTGEDEPVQNQQTLAPFLPCGPMDQRSELSK